MNAEARLLSSPLSFSALPANRGSRSFWSMLTGYLFFLGFASYKNATVAEMQLGLQNCKFPSRIN